MKELKNYPELKSLNTSVIPLPVIMRNMNLAPIKKKIIFGVIGYGLPQAFLKLLTLLDRMRISDDYEIRLIGMQPSLTLFKKYSNVVVSIPSTNHNILTRSEIERDIEDVNIQIILYPNNSYQLSQSLSIFEAIRYMKPVLHINNPCINFYNNSKKPIGLMCQSLEDMARTIKKLVEDKNYTFNLLKLFKYNLISVRKEYSIDRSVARLKNIYKNINIK
jgi:glycosyltransferase involved in cell wall biosynthesis